MAKTWRWAVVLAGSLLVASCGQVTAEPTPRARPSVAAVEPSNVTSVDRRLARSFVAFARDPDPATAARMRFASDGVAVGLAQELDRVVPRGRVADRAAWVISHPLFRGRVGSFSALTLIRHHVTGGEQPRRLRVSVGPHPHCASPPERATDRVTALRRVSLQPRDGSIRSCLDWFTVDLFVACDGEVVAVTLDLYEP